MNKQRKGKSVISAADRMAQEQKRLAAQAKADRARATQEECAKEAAQHKADIGAIVAIDKILLRHDSGAHCRILQALCVLHGVGTPYR